MSLTAENRQILAYGALAVLVVVLSDMIGLLRWFQAPLVGALWHVPEAA